MKKILIFLFLNLLIFSKALANNYAPEIIFSCIKKNSQKIDYYGFKKINNNYVISRYNHKSKKFYSSYSVLYTNENNMMWDYYSPIHGLIATYYFRSNNFSNEIITFLHLPPTHIVNDSSLRRNTQLYFLIIYHVFIGLAAGRPIS